MSVEAVVRPRNHTQEAERLLTLSVEVRNNATIVLAHVIVGCHLEGVVVMDHARPGVIRSNGEVAGSYFNIGQSSRSVVIETWD